MKNSEFEADRTIEALPLNLTPMEKASGATCNAYTARIFGKKVFVKEIKPEFKDDARMLAAFRKEAEIGFRLDHRNLPGYIYAEGVLPAERYIVQEYIDGTTLPDFIKENPAYFQDRKNVERFIREFVDVIGYLHNNQIIHLDIKPRNILITRVGKTLKLTDLGFCASDCYDDTRGFTPGYLPPEGNSRPCLRGEASDYYCLGKVLGYIRSLTPEFPAGRIKRLETALLAENPSDRPSSSEEIEKILRKKSYGQIIWICLGLAVTAAIFAALSFLWGSEPSAETQITELTKEQPSPVNNSPEIKDIADHSDTRNPAAKTPPLSASASYAGRPATAITDLSRHETPGEATPQESLAAMKKEMAADIKKNFEGFNTLLLSYLKGEKFSEKDKQEILDFMKNATRKSFSTEKYKQRYKTLSPALIDDTMAEVFNEIESADWGGNYKEYIRKCKNTP